MSATPQTSGATDQAFAPTLAAARLRLQAVRPGDYARSRNHLDGAVTRLSPYLTHGLLQPAQVLAHLQAAHNLPPRHKLVAELGWRAWFRHVWQHEGAGILRSLHAGPRPEAAYARQLPADLLQARTGLAVVDQAVRALHGQGWLHNHARLWLASYVVHGRGVHWRVGADWMFRHLLDGDLASNHLSWQWVAGTGSAKPYLFNAENVRRFAPPAWWVDGSVLDTDYDTLAAWARGETAPVSAPVSAPTAAPTATLDADPPGEPPCWPAPPPGAPLRLTPADPQAVAGREVWLVHAWALGEPPPGCPVGALVLPVGVADWHARWPWSARRWDFVLRRMGQLAPQGWWDTAAALSQALGAAGRVHGWADPHLGDLNARWGLRPPPAAFADPGRRCRSFSDWWSRVSAD
ncbi:FAD-binding domain-containing protein [Ideonella livida]|uniref:Deoxyribodipyrimidine photolyase n=1 Tax=Ideonella livida TaxID=2707176 RepID=A0A7C9TKF1_9BURK|nr:FAD-binding domain-containing protein [Ideonella livida]NDY92700.1 deoxyribodipyrimidine photolyase [Ideonella livida]